MNSYNYGGGGGGSGGPSPHTNPFASGAMQNSMMAGTSNRYHELQNIIRGVPIQCMVSFGFLISWVIHNPDLWLL